MANLGKSTDGADSGTISGIVSACQTTASESGRGSTLYARAKRTDTSISNIRFAVWADNGSNYPGSLLATGPILSFTSSSMAWQSGAITLSIASGTKYWLGGIGEYDGSGILSIARDATGGLNYIKTDTSYTLPNPFPSSATSGARIYDIYIPIEQAYTNVYDSLVAADNVAGWAATVGAYEALLYDSLVAVDNIHAVRIISLNANVADSITLLEPPLTTDDIIIDYSTSLYDAITIGDIATAELIALRLKAEIYDIVTNSDFIHSLPGSIYTDVASSITISDNATAALATGRLKATIYDILTIIENVRKKTGIPGAVDSGRFRERFRR